MITTFGELKRAVVEAEQGGLSEHALVRVVDTTSEEHYHIEEAMNTFWVTTDGQSNYVELPVFYIGIQLIMS